MGDQALKSVNKEGTSTANTARCFGPVVAVDDTISDVTNTLFYWW